MGVGSKAVVLMLTKSGGPVKAWIRCCQCDLDIAQIQVRVTNGLAYCLKCLKKEDKPPFGRRLRAYRVAKGLTPADLARKIGRGPSLINALENGTSKPTWDTLLTLVEVLGQGLVSEPPL
jgi:DNA-binding XRE family transcriptional regulator